MPPRWYDCGVGRERVSWIPLPSDWEPAQLAEVIHTEAEKRWHEGWIFVRAETDALMESVCLYFHWPEDGSSP